MKKNYISLLVLFAAGIFAPLSAQISQGGIPMSFTPGDKTKLSEVPFQIMPAVDVEALKKEDIYNDTIKDQPWRFGENIIVSLDPKNSGVWDVLENGSRLWRLGITSKGALTINLTFDNYRLPKGATLFIYNTDKSEVIGTFTDFNNQDDRYFATTLISGDSVIIEYYEPAMVAFHGELNLWRVTHGYRGIADYQKSFGESGTCNVNAVCSQGDPIRDQIRSVAIIVTGGSGFCTGSLINNTDIDGTPYFLSANHCYENPGTLVFWFNWQSATCSNPASSPAHNSMSGATQKAKYATSDFWLMQLNSVPPAEYNVYYSGWNHTTNATIGSKVWCIHHPMGDIKKISWCNAGVTTSAYLGATGSGTNHWRIGSWSDGTTTEAGSSGSPLFDTQGRIIGQLHGGWASCTDMSQDYYGKLGTSWTGGGTNSSRLSNWLDPAGTGAITLDGYDPNVTQIEIDGTIDEIIEPEVSYGDTGWITPTVVIGNLGPDNMTSALITCYSDYETPVSFEWTGNLATGETETIAFGSVALSWGSHTFVAKIIADGDTVPENDSMVLDYTVYACSHQTLPLDEGFNDPNGPYCWEIETVSGTAGTLRFLTAGSHPTCSPNEGSHMIEFNSYTATPGSELRLVSPEISTVPMENITLEFDWFHNLSFPSSDDKVTVQYSMDGENWTDVQEFLRYSPSITGWDTISVDLPADVEGKDTVFFGFLFHSESGNNCHLDHVYITSDITGPYADFTADSLIVYVNDTITFTDASLNGPFTSWKWNFGVGAKPASASGQGPHKVIYTQKGAKSVSLLVDDTLSRVKINYIEVDTFPYPIPYGLYAFVSDADVNLYWNRNNEVLFNDSFESGDFTQWDDVIEGPGTIGEHNYPYWFVQSNNYIYTGDYSALVSWGYDIDTWIISPVIPAIDPSFLSFIWQGSYNWNVDPNDHGDLWVKISTDEGSTWDSVWTFGNIGAWDNWTWYETTIDLSDYAGQDIQVAFNLVANDNGDVALEDVSFSEFVNGKSFGTRAISHPLSLDENAKSIHSIGAGTLSLLPLLKTATLVNYSIFRDYIEVATSETNSYSDLSLPQGVYSYYVVGNYLNPVGTSSPSNTLVVEVGFVSIDDKETGVTLLIYPNPSNGIFNIETIRDYTVTVLDLSGNRIDEFNVGASSRSIDLSAHGAGLYILKFRSDKNTFAVKVIVN